MSTSKIDISKIIEEGQEIASNKNELHTFRQYDDLFISTKQDEIDGWRDPFQRDYARVLHSSSFRRLQGKMQLLGTQISDYYRTRLTHSLEASQIGTTISRKIEHEGVKVNSALVAMACLAHDIGNPPFGHYAEKELNKLMKDDGGFEGNAQTLRILCKLEKKSSYYDGLNLTKAALYSVVKYGVYNTSQKQIEKQKFLYKENKQNLEDNGTMKIQTIEAQIMELADDIAYSTHDLEDGLKSGILSIDAVLGQLETEELRREFQELLQQAYKNCGETFGDVAFKSITSTLIDTFIKDIGVVELTEEQRQKKGTSFKYGLGLRTKEKLMNGLKKAVRNILIEKPSVALYEIRGAQIVNRLFELLNDDKYERLLPPEYRALIQKGEPKKRVVCDYIAGMTDHYAEQLYKQYFGDPNTLKI
ncbi:deoxyguanosinetriphosphate triphosphohydrolase [Geobacillus sp. 44C]|nr:deoxyguanosinetriphosphate triphosphohydrolase [Geobacillus sp. 44C]QNU34172.1 dNTP triphosphohydrolase [Geobacillus sp. 44C]